MAIALNRITGLKSGETVLTEEQVLTGYTVDVKYPALFDRNVLKLGTTTNSYVYVSFDVNCYAVLIEVTGNDLRILFRAHDDVETIGIPVGVNTLLMLDFMAKGFHIKSRVSNKPATYEVVGFYHS